MKTVTCDLCAHEVQAATFEDWMNQLKPHYKEAHSDFMQVQMHKSEAEQQAAMNNWMTENRTRFESL